MAQKSAGGAPAAQPHPQINGRKFWHYADDDVGGLRAIDRLSRAHAAEPERKIDSMS